MERRPFFIMCYQQNNEIELCRVENHYRATIGLFTGADAILSV